MLRTLDARARFGAGRMLAVLAPALIVSFLVPQRPALASDELVTAGADKKVKIWSTDGTLLKTLDTGPADALAVSPDGTVLAVGGDDGKVGVWALPSGDLKRTITAADKAVTCLCFTYDGTALYAGSAERKVTVWDMRDGKQISTIDAHEGRVINCFQVMNYLVTGGTDGKLKVWQADGTTMYDIPTDHTGGLTAVAGGGDVPVVYSGGADGTIKYWGQAAQGVFAGNQGGAVTAMAVSPDGAQLITGSKDGTVKVWDTDSYKLLTTFATGHTGGITGIVVSSQGKAITIYTAGADGKVRVWTSEGKAVKTIDAHDGGVTTIFYHAAPLAPPKKS